MPDLVPFLHVCRPPERPVKSNASNDGAAPAVAAKQSIKTLGSALMRIEVGEIMTTFFVGRLWHTETDRANNGYFEVNMFHGRPNVREFSEPVRHHRGWKLTVIIRTNMTYPTQPW